MKLIDAWERTVRADPEATALIEAPSGRRWSRAELDAGRRGWSGDGTVGEQGRAVFFRLPNGPAWWSAWLGILGSGRIAAAIDPAEPPAAAQSIVAAAPPRWAASTELLKLTSGTTGPARPLAFTGPQMLADGRHVCSTMDIRGGDLNVGLVPFGHSYGLGNLVVPMLAQGTPVLCGVDPLPQAIAEAVRRNRATILPVVPAILRALAASDLERAALEPLRLVISAGAILPPEEAAAFADRFGLRPHNFYGSSETGGIAYDRSGAATLTGRSVGRPLRGVRLRFTSRSRFAVVSAAVGGRGVRRPPDRARLNGRGELVLLGRTDRTLKIAGRRLNPGEVEAALRQLPGVRDAWIAAHPTRTDALAAVVAGAAILRGAALTDGLRQRLAGWKIPRKWVLVLALPLNARGKPDRRQLLELLK